MLVIDAREVFPIRISPCWALFSIVGAHLDCSEQVGRPEPGSERAGERELDFRLGFIDFARVHFISALPAVVLVTCLNQYVKRMTAPPSCGDLYADAHHDDGC